MAASTYFDQVQKLYIAYFGRPADPVGLAYWAANVDAANGNFSVAIAGFAASNESNALYSGTSSAQKVSAIYLAIFNRLPEPAGLAYWVGLIDSGSVSSAQAAYTILNSAGPGDATAVANKLAAANAFTAQIDTTTEITGYVGSVAAAYGRTYLSGVDATAGSLSNATNTTNLTNTVAIATNTTPTTPTTPAAGQTFTLTAGVDNITGTASSDTITSTVSGGFGPGDVIDGGAGNDTLTVSGSGNISSSGVTVTGVESASFTSSSSVALTTTAWTGLTSLTTQTTAGTTTLAAGSGTAIVSTALNQGANNIAINGGSSVSVTSTGVSTGNINIGGTTQPTGAVTVNATSASGSASMGAITITGGSVINVTQAANNAVNTTVSMGSVTVFGKAGTTSVNINNAAKATANGSTAGVTDQSVYIYDVNHGYSSTQVGTISSVSVKNYTALVIYDNALTNLSVAGGSSNIIIDNTSALTGASITRTLNLTVNGLTGGTLDDADLYTTLNVATTGTNSALANITFGSLNALTVSGSNTLSLVSATGMSKLDTVTVSGSAGLTANFGGTSTPTLTSVDASATSGPVAVTIDGTKASYSGGSGVDTVTLSGAAAPTKAISGGAGSSDVLILDATAASTLSNPALISGFEQVTLTGATNQTVDTSNFVGATTFSTSGGNGLTLNKLVSGNTLVLTSAGTAYTFGGDGFAAGGNDTLNLKLTDSSSGPVSFASTGITANAVENFAITTVDGQSTPTGNFKDGITLLGNTVQTITASGNAGLTLVANSTSVKSVDASGISLGGFTWTSGAVSATSLIVKGSASGANNIDLQSSTVAATYIGGSGNDTIVGTSLADSFTLGAGANSVRFSAAQFTGGDQTSLIANADSITDWSVTGATNSIHSTTSTLAKVDHATAAISGTASITNGFATFFSDATTLDLRLAAVVNAVNTDAAGTAVTFTYGADSYLFVVNDATAGVQSGDALIKLTGITATGLTIVGGDVTAFA